MSKVNWDHIKEVWLKGAEELSAIAKGYGISIPEISIRANTEQWGDRGTTRPICPSFDEATPILDDKQVLLAHKTDLGRLRLLAATVLESVQHEQDITDVLKVAERLAKIYNIVIPLERKVFGMDSDTSEIPDGIVINIGGEKE